VAVPVPDIAVAPSSFDYGDVALGGSVQQSFVVSNAGSADLTVSATSLVGIDAAEFSIDSGGGAFVLAPGATRDVLVSFNPVVVGAKSASLQFASDDPDENPLDVPLSGNGVENPPGGGPVVGSTSSVTVTTAANLTSVSDHLYLAAVSAKPHRVVSSVSGLGLVWTPLQVQCAGRNQTGVEVWMAQGTPGGDGAVTATLAAAPINAVIAVSRYSGVDAVSPIGNLVSGNTNGIDGVCADGIDSAAYSFNLTTVVDGALVYGAAAMRNRTHSPGAGYTEQVEFAQGIRGGIASVAVVDQTFSSASTVLLDGSFNKTVDWAVIGLEIKPAAGP
jgi:hypothetical protein